MDSSLLLYTDVAFAIDECSLKLKLNVLLNLKQKSEYHAVH